MEPRRDTKHRPTDTRSSSFSDSKSPPLSKSDAAEKKLSGRLSTWSHELHVKNPQDRKLLHGAKGHLLPDQGKVGRDIVRTEIVKIGDEKGGWYDFAKFEKVLKLKIT